MVDPAEQAAERKRVEEALAELHAEAEAKRNALAATMAKKLVVAEPESVIFGQSDGRQPSYNVQLKPPEGRGVPTAPQGDVETQVIIESEPVGNPSDSGQLAPTARRLAPLLGVRPPASDPAAGATAAATAETAAATTAAEPTPHAPEVPTAAAEPASSATEAPAATPPVMLIADAGYSSANDAIACEALGYPRGPRGSSLPRGGGPGLSRAAHRQPARKVLQPDGLRARRPSRSHDLPRRQGAQTPAQTAGWSDRLYRQEGRLWRLRAQIAMHHGQKNAPFTA